MGNYQSFTITIMLCLFISSCSSDEKNDNSIKEIKGVNNSQTELNLNSEEMYIASSNELEVLLKKIQNDYSDDTTLLNNLQNSQKKWIDYRDAQILMKYPTNDPLRNGSGFNTCYFSYLTDLTKNRIDHLLIWDKKAEEGDICSGSIKITSN
jgi:uncharacterized protein YecT (DUF1311 family)